MTYTILVPKMHCSGCVNLMKVSLSDEFENVQVNLESKIVEFESDEDMNITEEVLNKIFEELKELGYEFKELRTISK